MAPEPAVLRVLARFGLAPALIESISPLVSGAGRHPGYRVRADRRDWVLKRHTSAPAIARLTVSHPLELRLREAGFPSAPLGRTDTGQTLVREGPAKYSLHGWVDGHQVSIAGRDELIARHPNVVGELASMIGTLHQLSRTPGDDAGGQSAVDTDRLLKAPHLGVRALRRSPAFWRWRALRLKRGMSDFDRWVIDVLPEVVAHADLLASRSVAHRLDRSDTGLIHNDINWENLVFDERFRVRALLDFDNATRAPWALEVGSAAVVLVGAEPDRVEEFVSTYESASQIRVDRDVVRLAMEMKCVQSILNSMTVYIRGNADIALRAPWCYHLHESLKTL